jgi:hypothetical protein
MSNVTYFASRTAARNAVVDGTKFKDFGADAAKGERWATIKVPSAAPTLRTAATKTPKTRTPRTNSKKATAVALIVSELAAGADRQTILAKLVSSAGLTLPGASTYYANVKNGTWA